MRLCRNAWQKLAPLTHRGTAALLRNASVRQMSSSNLSSSAGETLPYYIAVVVAMTGGGIYAYRTLNRDKARLNERYEYINTHVKHAFEDYETKSNTVDTSAVLETSEEAVESAIEEVSAEEVPEPEASPPTPLVEEQTVAEDESAPAPTEQEPAPTEEPEAGTEAAAEQVEPKSIESVGEAVEGMSPVLEASSHNIAEELASAAEDWSELTARKPEETEEAALAALEIKEAAESEQTSESS